MLRFSRLGVALRSVAENTERASMLGISTGGITTLAWAIAGMLGGVAVLLTGVTGTPGVTQTVDAGERHHAAAPLTAAVLARFRSFGVATLAAVLISVLPRRCSWPQDSAGLRDRRPAGAARRRPAAPAA